MYLAKNRKSLYKKIGIVSLVFALAITGVGLAVWRITLKTYPKLDNTPYSFKEMGNSDTLAGYLTDVKRSTPKNDTGFLLDFSTSACPVCHSMRDLPENYYDYYANHISQTSADTQDKWLTKHGLGNGALNDYANGTTRNNDYTDPIVAHNVKSIWIDGFKTEDSAGFNFQSNPFYNWAYRLVTNHFKLGWDDNAGYSFNPFDDESSAAPYDGSYAGWLNNNRRPDPNTKDITHWFYLKKLSKDDEKHVDPVYKVGWNQGYYNDDTSPYNAWPLLVWMTYEKGAQSWKVSGWTTGYYNAEQLQSLSKLITAEDESSPSFFTNYEIINTFSVNIGQMYLTKFNY